MTRDTIVVRLRTGRMPALLACVTGWALLAGCATTPTEIREGPDQPQPAPAPAAKPAAPQKDAAKTPPQPAAPQKAPPKTVQPVAQPAPKDAAAGDEAAEPDLSKMSEEELIEMIKAAVLEAQKTQQAEGEPVAAPPPPTTQPRAPAATTKPVVKRPIAPATRPFGKQAGATSQPASEPTSQPTSQAASCHGSAAAQALEPPPVGSPQPKCVCKEPKVSVGPVWKGKPAVPVFEIANEGEGPLQIRLQGG